MNDTILIATERRMQSEILGERLVEALDHAMFADQGEARDAERYGKRIGFALQRVTELRESARQSATLFEAARLDVALTILEGHVFRAADFVDGIARRQRTELSRVNRRIAGETVPVVVLPRVEERAA
jgi:protein subunit release factor A